MTSDNEIWILVDRTHDPSTIGANYLKSHIGKHIPIAAYATREEAEEGRRRGDAYDDPDRTKVIGFRIERIANGQGKARFRDSESPHCGNCKWFVRAYEDTWCEHPNNDRDSDWYRGQPDEGMVCDEWEGAKWTAYS